MIGAKQSEKAARSGRINNIVKKRGAFLVAMSLLALVVIMNLAPLFPFIPVFCVKKRMSDFELCRVKYALNDSEMSALTNILSNYNEPFLVKGSTITIQLRLFIDKELMWNYTSKAKLKHPSKRFVPDSDPWHHVWLEMPERHHVSEKME